MNLLSSPVWIIVLAGICTALAFLFICFRKLHLVRRDLHERREGEAREKIAQENREAAKAKAKKDKQKQEEEDRIRAKKLERDTESMYIKPLYTPFKPRPILEPVNQPIWDTVKIETNHGKSYNATDLRFEARENFPDGSPRRVGLDVSVCGNPIPAPCFFSLGALDIILEEIPKDVAPLRLLQHLEVSFILGVKVYYELNGSLFEPVAPQSAQGEKGVGVIGDPDNWKRYRYRCAKVLVIPPMMQFYCRVKLHDMGTVHMEWVVFKIVLRGTLGRPVM